MSRNPIQSHRAAQHAVAGDRPSRCPRCARANALRPAPEPPRWLASLTNVGLKTRTALKRLHLAQVRMKSDFLFLWASLLLAACATAAPAPTAIRATAVPSSSALVITPSASPMVTATSGATSSPPSVVSTLAPLHPEIVNLCPSERFIPLENLGLAPETLLLVVPETSEAYWDENDIGWFVLTSAAPTPQRLNALIEPDHINSRTPLVSPNGRWLIIRRKGDGASKSTPWLSSVDGKQQWPLTTDEQLQGGTWLDD